MHEGGSYVHAPNDYYRELERRTAARHARISTMASVISAVVATAAVTLSAIALIMGAQAQPSGET